MALVVDPQRDIDRVDAALAAAGHVRITHVAETHIHNDYLTGGVTLAPRHGAAYLVNAADNVSYDRMPVEPGQTLEVGRLVVEVVATPGHTDTHLAYVVRDGDQRAVFSGGSLLFGSVGRTDLLGAERGAELAAAQHALRTAPGRPSRRGCRAVSDARVRVVLRGRPGRWGDEFDDQRRARLLFHSAAGYRAGVAASLLDRAGCDVVHVDDAFDRAALAGAPLTHGLGATAGG